MDSLSTGRRGLLAGLLAALFCTLLPEDAEARRRRRRSRSRRRAGRAVRARAGGGGVGTYLSCSEARAAGAAPLRRGRPGYSTRLDRDGDGIACE